MLDLSLFRGRRLRFIAASELNECGLACLASVAEYYRGNPTLSDIRELAQHSGRGATLLDVRDLAEKVGLSARGVRIELSDLAQLSTPSILHWDMNHFVVLERVTRKGVVIMDPAGGRMEVGWKDVHKSFTGVALELTPSERWEQRKNPPRRVSVLDFVRPLSRWRTDIALIVALSLLLEVLVLVLPLQMQMSVDHAVQSADGRLVWILMIGFGVVVIIQTAVSLVRAWGSAVFSTRVGFDLYDRFVQALHRKPARFFLKHHTADILHRGRSVMAIQTLMTAKLVQAMLDGLMSIAMLAVMFIVVPLMATIVLGFGLANVIFAASLRQAAIDTSRRHLRTGAKADSLFLENARAARAIKLFGKERVRTNIWRNKFAELTNLSLTTERLMMYSTEAARATSYLGGVVLIGTGTYLVLQGSITLGTMMMFIVFRVFFVDRLNDCVSYMMDLRRMQGHAERIAEVVGQDHLVDDEPIRRPFSVASSTPVSIEAKDVWFRYGNDTPWILRGVNMRIAPGEAVAVTGPSGCGKTTLLNVLLGLLEPNRGEVIINGRDLRTISSYDYAKLIGVVMQDDILFEGTVAENIAFFDTPINFQRVAHCAEQANVRHDIEAMPMGYYSLLAEAAIDISGGQKQRIFIARALYHDPKVLFLDEATSHLDSDSEQLVSQAVRKLDLTRLLAAHRRETIATADRVVALREGIVEEVSSAPPHLIIASKA